MVENFFFEIEHYGSILNANRSYYLSRSQPPFLTSMVLGVYEAEKSAGHEDKKWLARAYRFAKKDHAMWAREPHLAADTGLSRYYDFGDVPAPESLKDETDHYRKVAAYFLNHPEQDRGYLLKKRRLPVPKRPQARPIRCKSAMPPARWNSRAVMKRKRFR